jgi:hypothetical protein
MQARAAQCMAEMNAATQQMTMGAMNGMVVNDRPVCEQYMPQWTAQEACLETEIYRLQTGDTRSSVREITGIPGPDYSSRGGPSSSYSPSNDPSDAVDNWDRQAIRGNSLYTDETGEEHELLTRNYYFRDRASGQLVGSDQADPPNNGRDYERLESNRPQQ